MTADDDGYAQVLRRVVAGLGDVAVATSVDELDDAWARARERGQATVHVVVPAPRDDVRRAVRATLAERGWVMVGMTRVMWPGASGPAAASRQQRIDRDTRDVVAEVVPAGADAVPLLADALDRTAAEVDTLLDLAGHPQARGESTAPDADQRDEGLRRRRRLLGRRAR